MASMEAESKSSSISKRNGVESPLLRLPAELRNMIYGYALDTAIVDVPEPPGLMPSKARLRGRTAKPRFFHKTPHLLFVCTQIHREAQDYLDKYSIVELDVLSYVLYRRPLAVCRLSFRDLLEAMRNRASYFCSVREIRLPMTMLDEAQGMEEEDNEHYGDASDEDDYTDDEDADDDQDDDDQDDDDQDDDDQDDDDGDEENDEILETSFPVLETVVWLGESEPHLHWSRAEQKAAVQYCFRKSNLEVDNEYYQPEGSGEPYRSYRRERRDDYKWGI